MKMKIVARDKNFSILIQVAEVINLKYTRFIIYRMLGSDWNRKIEKDEENAFLIAIHLKYFGY